MSNGNGGNGGPPSPPDISVTSYDIAPPDKASDLPYGLLEQYFRDTFDLLNHKWKIPGWLAAPIAGLIVALAALFILICHTVILVVQPWLPAFGGAVFQVIDDLRKTLDPQFAQFSVAVLNELLGTEFSVEHLPQGGDVASHIARAEEIGLLFHRQILSEFLTSTGITLDPSTSSFTEPTGATGAGEKITPMSGVHAAARFTGLAINFGTATGILATIGGLVPEVHLDEIREIGEEVAKNLGLGRLQRLALAPLVQILLAEPYKWFINETARPTQFGLGEVVNPFSGAVMDPKLIWTSLARAGYSDDKIQAAIELHRKKPGESDFLTLFEGGHFTDQDVQNNLVTLGYSHDGASRKFEADHLRAQRPFQDELRAAAVEAFAAGHIQQDELQGIVNSMPLSDDEKALVMLTAQYKKKVPSKHLTLAELTSAFDQGIIDLTEWTDHLTNLGYSDDDQSILLLLMLNKEATAKKKAAAAAARTAAIAAKKAGAPAITPLPPATSEA